MRRPRGRWSRECSRGPTARGPRRAGTARQVVPRAAEVLCELAGESEVGVGNDDENRSNGRRPRTSGSSGWSSRGSVLTAGDGDSVRSTSDPTGADRSPTACQCPSLPADGSNGSNSVCSPLRRVRGYRDFLGLPPTAAAGLEGRSRTTRTGISFSNTHSTAASLARRRNLSFFPATVR